MPVLNYDYYYSFRHVVIVVVVVVVVVVAAAMPISRHRFELALRFVIEWANDVPFQSWFGLICDHYGLNKNDTEPDYEVVMRNGKPYLMNRFGGGMRPSLDMTSYMFTFKDTCSTKSNINLSDFPSKDESVHGSRTIPP